MDRQILNITANEQILTVDEPIRISTNKVNYIEAHFDLGQNWSGYDSVRAVWFNDFKCISTVLDSQGVCLVPFEVMKRNGKVKVNLVGSISENDVLTDRLTSYPIVAVVVDCTAMVNGAETSPITPSQFEQYVAIVRGLVDSVKDIDHIELNPDYTLTIYYSDGTSDTTGSVRGADGNGIESVTKTGTSGLVDTYTITFTDGQTTTFTVTNGAKGDTGNGIQSIAKTSTVGLVDTYTITYTNGTTTTFTVTNGEKGDKGEQGDVSLAQLYAVYPTDTASGSIASFLDGADDVPMLSVVADIEPIQDLHGYDKPWSGGAGKNLLPVESTITITNGTITPEADGLKMVVTGSNGGISIPNIALESGEYAISVKLVSGTVSSSPYLGLRNASESAVLYSLIPTTVGNVNSAHSSLSDGTYRFYCNELPAGTYTVAIQIEKGSSPSSYAPYSNICPIYGHTEEVVSVSPTTSASDATTYTTQFGQTVYGGTLDVVSGELTVTAELEVFDTVYSDGALCSQINSLSRASSGISTIGEFTRISFAIRQDTDQSKYNRVSNSSGYTEHMCNLAPHTFGYNVESTHWYRNTALYLFLPTSLVGSTAQSVYDYLVSIKDTNPLSLWIPLATPQTIQLTPQEIDSFKGQNNLWASTGEIEVEYRADIGLYIATHGGGTYDTWQGGSY